MWAEKKNNYPIFFILLYLPTFSVFMLWGKHISLLSKLFKLELSVELMKAESSLTSGSV